MSSLCTLKRCHINWVSTLIDKGDQFDLGGAVTTCQKNITKFFHALCAHSTSLCAYGGAAAPSPQALQASYAFVYPGNNVEELY